MSDKVCTCDTAMCKSSRELRASGYTDTANHLFVGTGPLCDQCGEDTMWHPRLEVQSETGAGPEVATVKLFIGTSLLATVTGKHERMMGADSGYYDRIVFEQS